MNTVKWNPAKEIEQILDRYSRSAEEGSRRADDSRHETMVRADWAPTVDISETSDEYLIKAELPEVKKKDVKVTINSGVLVIQGKRNLDERGDRKYHRVERAYGTFARSFTLPDEVDEEKIRAEHNNGLLYLHLPKHQAPPPKSVEIEVN